MSILVTIVHVIVCIFLMLTVLLQAGKGGGMGAAFGGGSSSGTVFGGSGAGNFLRKLTVIAATIFMLSSMTLAYLASATGEDSLKQYSVQQRQAAEEKQKLHQQALDSETAPATDEGEASGGEGAVDEGTLGEPIEPLGSPLEVEDVTGEEPAAEEPAAEEPAAEPSAPAEGGAAAAPSAPAPAPSAPAPADEGGATEASQGAEAGSP